MIYSLIEMEEIKAKEISLGERVRLLRERQRLLQKNLAESAGLSVQTICNLEKGKGRPTLATIKKIAEALKVPATVLFDDELKRKKLLRDELRKKMAQIEELAQSGDREKAKKLLDEILGLFRSFGEEVAAHAIPDDRIKNAISESNLPEASKDILLYLYTSITKNN